MTSNRKNLAVLLGVTLPTVTLLALWLNAAGASDDNLNIVLRLTARLSFMIYLVIFVARPLRQLIITGTTRWLLRERRSLGIAFATMHSIHLGLIAYRYNTIPDIDFQASGSVPGMLAYTFIYLMLITSFDAPTRALGPKLWRLLHKTGLYFIGLIFVATLLPEEGEPIYTFERAWFVVLTGAAAFVRLTAWFAGRKKRNRPRPGPD